MDAEPDPSPERRRAAWRWVLLYFGTFAVTIGGACALSAYLHFSDGAHVVAVTAGFVALLAAVWAVRRHCARRIERLCPARSSAAPESDRPAPPSSD